MKSWTRSGEPGGTHVVVLDQQIPVHEQVQVLALTGNFAVADSRPRLHAHVVVAGRDGAARGGHLLRGRVCPPWRW